ncbi:uncharacterized protein LOC106013419, partial [Aplysia californica]|uniref:Uncharacterized protein LOC106013419 n=1 Tax=Aplysia californica TaxID=6500 RepID=A0ABM1ABK6_APLCA
MIVVLMFCILNVSVITMHALSTMPKQEITAPHEDHNTRQMTMRQHVPTDTKRTAFKSDPFSKTENSAPIWYSLLGKFYHTREWEREVNTFKLVRGTGLVEQGSIYLPERQRRQAVADNLPSTSNDDIHKAAPTLATGESDSETSTNQSRVDFEENTSQTIRALFGANTSLDTSSASCTDYCLSVENNVSCPCDPVCFFRNSCCRDIDQLCPAVWERTLQLFHPSIFLARPVCDSDMKVFIVDSCPDYPFALVDPPQTQSPAELLKRSSP